MGPSAAEQLVQRREQLVARSEAQRAVLVEHIGGLRAQLTAQALLGRGMAAVAGSARGRSLAPRLIGAALLGWKCWRLFQAWRSR